MSKSIAVGVIGAGVMGEALIAALIAFGVKPELITISEKRKDRADERACQTDSDDKDQSCFDFVVCVSSHSDHHQLEALW
jgi:pyrroline-5-carboxylate reductase